ncbi:helix-turn-helix domain-containing protein, partial [Anaerospora hongkongensis]
MKYFRESGEDENRSKREQILDAAYQIFSQKGYHRTTIDEIIALADTGKGTVYNYFVNKEQLF